MLVDNTVVLDMGFEDNLDRLKFMLNEFYDGKRLYMISQYLHIMIANTIIDSFKYFEMVITGMSIIAIGMA